MQDQQPEEPGMSRNVRRLLIVAGFLALTLGATAIEIALKTHQQRPLVGNIIALALLNVNVLLLVVLLLLLGRQLAKLYFEKKASPFGAGFKIKLVTAFIGLSIVPAALLFVVASGLLTGGVKYWFGPRVENTMKDSIALVNSYKEDRVNSAVHYAEKAAGRIEEGQLTVAALSKAAQAARAEYGLDAIEIYNSRGKLLASSAKGKQPWTPADEKFVGQAFKGARNSDITPQKKGDIVRGAAVYRGKNGKPAGVVVADYFLSSVISTNIADITRFYEEYWSLRTFKNPLKESYMLSFMLVTLLIVFAALWFGLYLSKSVTVPITSLAEATDRISKGDYDFQIDVQATDELGVLVDSFRRMTRDLKGSREKVAEANLTLSRANELLEQRRRFIESVLENVNTGVITIDRAGRISTVNRAAGRILSLAGDSIAGRNYREVFEMERLGGIREQVARMAEKGGASVEENVQLTVGGRSLNLRLFVSALQDTDGGYMGILVVFDDMTELMKAQRAAAWKEVARRIAHEVKNPLTPIQLSAQRLRKRYLEGTGDYDKIINECTETIIKQVEGMKTLVDEFSRFARMPEVDPRPSDLHAIIDEVAALYSGAHKDIEIRKDYDPNMPAVSVDGEQMKRVFMNLFDNAVTAMEGRGALAVKTAHEDGSGMARVEVADEGPGILPEDTERLFQPYFSKKKSGTGLGLAIVNRIVSDHGGYIRAEANQPKGARFVIELPVRG